MYALVTPRATKESMSGLFFINDLKPLIIISRPGKSKANVANEAWKKMFPNNGKSMYFPSARWPRPEKSKSSNAKVSFCH